MVPISVFLQIHREGLKACHVIQCNNRVCNIPGVSCGSAKMPGIDVLYVAKCEQRTIQSPCIVFQAILKKDNYGYELTYIERWNQASHVMPVCHWHFCGGDVTSAPSAAVGKRFASPKKMMDSTSKCAMLMNRVKEPDVF